MKINVSTLYLGELSPQVRYEVRVLRPLFSAEILHLIELRKCSDGTNLGDLCSVHFLPKSEWIKVGEITCYFSF